MRWLIPTVGTEHKLGYNQNKVFVEKQEKGRVVWIGFLITNVAHGVRSMDLSSSRKCFANSMVLSMSLMSAVSTWLCM